ncbi:unnamed protein product [Rotaria socialis]|uniref:Uncharacterized protein n=1 Tax=Rotaria socialis TaxID=392032 RepID=A0A820V8E2_9BILA|nr:unnamed protein product [Rotaria socialis]
MVFEKLVVHLLEKYLSEYIENFDSKKLKIDVWSGNVVLENVYLKPNALADLDLPLTIIVGHLKKLTLQVPWKNLYTHPTKLTIDGLYLLVIPRIEISYNAKQAEKERHEAKMKEVDKIEQIQKDKEDQKNIKKVEKDNDTFSARLKLQIIQNLELSIHNIHLVYEDRTTKPNHPFAFGITLNYITFQTTNKEWKPTITKENSPVIHKLGELNALSIYWNTNIKSNSILQRNEIINNLQTKIAVDNEKAPQDMLYIFRPFNAKAKLIMTMKPRELNFQRPMFYIAIDLGQISLNLNRSQYLDIIDLLEFQDHISARLKYIKYRPKTFDTIRQKWIFAYNAIVDEKIRPRLECFKWKNIKTHLENCREYRFIYVQELTGKITNEQKQRAEVLEKKLDVFNLTYIRQRAQLEARKKKEEPKKFLKKFSNLWNKKSSQSDPELDLENLLSAEEKKKLYQSIGYEGEDTSTITYPKDYIDIDLAVRLVMLDFNIWSKIDDNDEASRVITRAALPNTEVVFKRRPATSSILIFASLSSFQVFGITTDLKQSELSNDSRPILIHPANRLSSSNNELNQPKLLQIELETNPLDKDSDYRIKVISQSLEIKYNAPTINKLVECFEQDTRHNLQGVKKAASATYTDVKHQSVSLMKNNVEKIKVLDIYIDLQSSYFLLPENGVYYEGCPAICLDMGHLILKQSINTDQKDKETMANYTKFQLELKNFQLLYANKNENWQDARQQESTHLHLIKPITLYINLYKCIFTDSINLPLWKISGQIPAINMRISDMRLFNIVKHMQSLPLPESKKQSKTNEAETWTRVPSIDITQLTLETIENMAHLKKLLPTVADESQEIVEKVQEQFAQFEANFKISQIEISLEEERENQSYPIFRISLVSICAQTCIKTFDIELEVSLHDFIIYHEQFITKDNQHLRFLAAQHEENQVDVKMNSKELVSIHILHTSPDNPLFKSPQYNGIENKVRIQLNKLIFTMHLEALLSIMKFQNNIMEKWPRATVEEQAEKTLEEHETVSTLSKFMKTNNISTATTLEMEANLEQFHIVIATIDTQMFEVYVHGINANVRHQSDQTLVNLVLTNFCIVDPHTDARFRKIISQQSGDKELFSASMVLFNYPKRYKKTLDDVDSSLKINFAKANIVLLYKHINQIMGFLDALDITKAALELASNQANHVYEQAQKLQKQAFKLRLDATFNAPNIIVPINAYADEALFLDLGKINLATNFIDDQNTSLVEQQQIKIENVLVTRVKLDKNNEVESGITLLDCANFKIVIDRLLDLEKIKSSAQISIAMQLDLIHFQLAKTDYLCAMKILAENFHDQTTTNVVLEQYSYRQDEQKREENALRNTAAIQKQNECKTDEIFEKIKIQAGLTKLAVTLYLGESKLIERYEKHDKKLALAYVEVDVLDVLVRQCSDSSFKVTASVKDIRFDDIREADKVGAVVHMIDRHFTVDPNAYMLNTSLEFKPENKTRSVAQQLLNAKLESLYICIKLDYLMILKEFFMSDLPIIDKNLQISNDNIQTRTISKQHQSSETSTASAIDTRIEIVVKNPEIILLEDQHNANSHCIVLNFALKMRVMNFGYDTKVFGSLNDLTIYTSNFAELKSSKVKYRILQPATVDLAVIMDLEQQKIDIRCSHILINIMPVAVRILIGVTNSLSKPPPTSKQEKFDTQNMFDPKAFNESDFWYLKEGLSGISAQEKSLVKQQKNVEKYLTEQFVLTLTTMEIKLDIGFGSVTKSVVAMCLSNSTVNVKNWSDEMTASLTMDIEAALYNEHTLAWEPLIEPILDENQMHLAPLSVMCSIKPILPIVDRVESSSSKKGKQEKIVLGLDAKQLIFIRTQQLLNITITKTGLELMANLSSLFNDIYNQRLPKNIDNNESMLTLMNLTGQPICIENLNGLEFTNNITWTSTIIQQSESIPLTASAERLSSVYRLSVIEKQTSEYRQEFSVQIDNNVKLISINRTWQRIYDIKPSTHLNFPIQLLCDTQIDQNRRRVTLSSIVKIYNNTTIPMFILDRDSTTGKSYYRIEINEYYSVPINLLYKTNNPSIFISTDENDQSGPKGDFFAFDWMKATTQEQKLKSKNGKIFHFIICKETKDAYSENTDQLDRMSYNIYIHSPIHLTNLLPIDIQCSMTNTTEHVHLTPSQLQHISSGGKNSILKFTIPSYNGITWTSDPVDLGIKKRNNSNEQIVTFHDVLASNKQDILRMCLYMTTLHEVQRLSLYAPYWIVNHTDLNLEFRIGNERVSIKNTENAYLVCPDKYKSDSSEKGQIRLYGVTQDDSVKNWSEKFSLDVIKSIGMASCKGANNKIYMICVDIQTSSFGLTKTIILSPAMVMTNKTSLPIEIVESLMGKEQDKWKIIEPDGVIPFWPQNSKDGLLLVRYAHNQKTSKPFSMNKKHQTLLYTNDQDRLVIFVEVMATDFDGVRVIFSDYKQGDAPVLLVNHTDDQLISFVQKDDEKTQHLVPNYSVYYTWADPLKAREIVVTCNNQSVIIELNPHQGVIGMNENIGTIFYAVFIDDVQTVLLFTYNKEIIESVYNLSTSSESICRRIQLGVPNVGLSLVNDITREELLYISLKKSKVLWVQVGKSRVKPLAYKIHTNLEELYKSHIQHIEINPTDQSLVHTKYQMPEYREVTFHENTAELINQKGERKLAKRKSLDGLWIEYTWSMKNAALYARINRIQIDNQLESTNFQSALYPILSKSADSDLIEKPFIELSIYESKALQSNIMHFQYCKLLIQEFALRVDQGLILAILIFLRQQKNAITPMIDMDQDLEHIHKSLQAIVKAQTDTSTNETRMFFDNIHLSPLKVSIESSLCFV